MKNHRKTHEKNRPKPFKCQRCGFATDNTGHFKKHQKFHDRQDKKFAAMKNPVQCEDCQTFYKDVKALKNHINHVHPKYVYQCDLCAKVIKMKHNLVRHAKRHIRNINKNYSTKLKN